MSTITIRVATEADQGSMAAIYAHYVLNSPATFELEPPDAGEMERRRRVLADKGLPWLVAVSADGTVTGYAYAGPYRSRPAYDWTLEDSIYIHPGHLGRGLGRALLEPLIVRCTELGYRQMVAVIGDSANAGSIALHRACGFTPVGVLADVGWKFDRWIDSVLMQRPLGAGAGEAAAER